MPKQERSIRTRDLLLEEGLSALIRRGYNGTGIKEVLEEAGVPKGSFYNYFESKEDFASQVIDLYADRFHAELGEAFADGPGALDRVRDYFDEEIPRQLEAGAGCLLGNLGAEVGATNPGLRQAMARGMGGTRERFAGAIEQGQADGTVRTDRTAEELAGVLFAAWEGALLRMQVEASREPLDEFSRLMIDDFLRP
ncbi:MAG: TetR family transcriptional regulator C-terminal domain-containing protein [Gemmatimonadota bacterium]